MARSKLSMMIILILSIISLTFAADLIAQSADYHREESPVISWNGINLYDARSAATAGISVFSSTASAAVSNPALMRKTDVIYLSGSYTMIGSTAYQYGAMNTGVFYNVDKIYEFNDCFSNISSAFSLGELNIGVGYYKNTLIELPDFNVSGDGYSSSSVFSGKEDAFYFALSYPLSDLTLGAKLTYISGNRSLNLTELYDSVITIIQNEDYDFDYFMLSFGTVWKTSEKLRLSAVFNFSIASTINSEIERSFDAQTAGGGHIYSTTSSEDDLYRPSKLIISAHAIPFLSEMEKSEHELNIGLEIGYIFWNSYKYVTFGEELTRNFEDTVLLAIGIELPISCRGFDIALRGGYRLDPQPVPEPETTLHWLTFGAGLSIWDITLDVAGSYCFGSLTDWTAQNFSVITTLGIRL
jgi:hypothetical protein